MSDLLKEGESKGECRLDGPDSNPFVGIVFQNAESQILSTTVGDEVAFGPANLGVEPDKIEGRVRRTLDAVGLSGYETRNVEGLSAGEKHRLTLASVLSMEPSLLLLDEPTAQLDARGKEALRRVLKGLKERSYTIVVADHDMRPYEEIADRFLLMDAGVIERETRVAPFTGAGPAGDGRERPRPSEKSDRPAIGLDKVCFSRNGGRPVIDGLSLHVYPGERIHLCGANGAGKSTLFMLMTGLLRPDSGSVNVLGLAHPRPESLRGKVGLLLQNPVRQLFENTVYEEVAFSLKRRGLTPAEIDGRTIDALALCDLLHVRDRSPFSLSYGEKHRVTLASLMALKPQVLLLDEPFSGLEIDFRYRILEMLRDYGERHGSTIVVTSHDPLVDASWADRSFSLEEGRLGGPSAI
jgi:energy-coupling factor transport system ATP-binding protein